MAGYVGDSNHERKNLDEGPEEEGSRGDYFLFSSSMAASPSALVCNKRRGSRIWTFLIAFN